MSMGEDDRNRRRFMRRALTMVPAVGMVAAAAPSQADSRRERDDALDAEALENILYWGADPSGRRDSSAAFVRAVRSQRIKNLYIPPGTYAIGRHVDLKRCNLVGGGRSRADRSGGEGARLVPHHTLGDEPMFSNHGPVVRDLVFDGKGFKGELTCLQVYGYNSVIENVSFTSAARALYAGDNLVNFNLLRCTFVGIGTGLLVDSEDSESTTVRLIGNEFNYCDDAFITRGRLHGSTFQDNIFENLRGDAILAQLIYNSNFIGNWWEGRVGDKKPWPTLRTTMSQQIMNCFAAANKAHYGWDNIFASEKNSGRMGGVSTDNGVLVVRESTAKSVRVEPTTIRAMVDEWGPATPFVIQSSASSESQHTNPLVFRHSAARGNIEFDTAESAGQQGVWDGSLRFASQVEGKDTLHYDEYRINRERPGILGQTALVDGKGKLRHALTGVAQFVRWHRHDSDGPGCDFFDRHEEIDDGRVELSFPEGDVEFRDPVITVTVDDSGVVCDGIEHIPSYSGASQYRAWKGFVFRFIKRDSGHPHTPDAFSVQLFHPQ
ncbi:hypothetical protein [Kushneria phosphatilytica]|uniref:Uncharacterized protein n=1 Tax=Kushneria phosphatilytica TaxID=657387 RepID=A0A1S1NVE7_9GAMM|nr:hypothetical protein [Kushneria phosphatilytica]OHV10557.1 hypothetical protein BH688_09190 [Kushneria phosphatilytica]QEL11870.1 hypothetical protein FY550_12480 [Kushneria phosphatilytica]